MHPCEGTVLVALDLSKAFDSVSHSALVDDILSTGMPGSTIIWLKNYMKKLMLSLGTLLSNVEHLSKGWPYGSDISPTPFNLFMCFLPTLPPEIKMVTYADDENNKKIIATGYEHKHEADVQLHQHLLLKSLLWAGK